MRLINAETLLLEAFIGTNIPPYAILSHTWGPDEVSLQDLEAYTTKKRESKTRSKSGYSKIVNACEQALARGLAYCWVDTCCIDKSSSAELTEAINSMFSWYENAAVCLVYLEDYLRDDGKDSTRLDIRHCRWLTRGWCLQELIAPRELLFFDSAWSYVADKTGNLGYLSQLTKIPGGVLSGSFPLSSVSIASRLSWASGRQTTRLEDEAYSLLGLLDINMPMLYGEGRKAFQRLQHEIIKVHDDPSIFAWYSRSSTTLYQSMFAPSIHCFADCGDFLLDRALVALGNSFSQTSRGVRVESPNLRLSVGWKHAKLEIYSLVLENLSSNRNNRPYELPLIKVRPGGYLRLNRPIVRSWDSAPPIVDPLVSEEYIYIIEPQAAPNPDGYDPGMEAVRVKCEGLLAPLRSCHNQEIEPRAAWDSANSRFFVHHLLSPFGYIKLYYKTTGSAPLKDWFILFMTLDLVQSVNDGSSSKRLVRWFLVSPAVWGALERAQNKNTMVASALKHKDTVAVRDSSKYEKYQVGKCKVYITVTIDAISISAYN